MIGDCDKCGHSAIYHVPLIGCAKCSCDEFSFRPSRSGPLLLCALLLISGQAQADPVDAGSPQPAQAVTLAFPSDGGPALPAPIHAGQVAPADGVFLSLDRAAVMAGERVELKGENADLRQALAQAQPTAAPIPGVVWLLVCLAGTAAGAYLGSHHK